ncbi:MAG TPA: hypothetical protein VM032_19050 [Vicinamibacterales bacterium]|nr:hypothetical protein [Vicinamibacterales bacterium]
MTFPANSRYAATPVGSRLLPDGREVAYLRRRFVPSPENFALLQEHFVVEGDRLDVLTARYIGDPEQFWRVCDANPVLHPEELTAAAGTVIRITLPEGVPAPSVE